MATATVMIDDLTGIQATTELPVTTRQFELDGTSYEIDLTDDNYAAMCAAMADYTAHARKATSGRASTPRSTGTSARAGRVDREQNAAIREWARRNGHKLADRGRIPVDVQNAYHNGQDVAALQALPSYGNSGSAPDAATQEAPVLEGSAV
jgi:hypothetical protein